jgi:hypothetical protein
MSGKWLNRDKVIANLRKAAAGAIEAGAGQLKVEVDDLVAAQKRAAPVDPTSPNPGALRDSIHSYATPNRPYSYRILASARGEDGEFIGSHVEAGHRARDGTHVPASPSFFPTYRARKRGMRRRIMAKTRAALKQLFPR